MVWKWKLCVTWVYISLCMLVALGVLDFRHWTFWDFHWIKLVFTTFNIVMVLISGNKKTGRDVLLKLKLNTERVKFGSKRLHRTRPSATSAQNRASILLYIVAFSLALSFFLSFPALFSFFRKIFMIIYIWYIECTIHTCCRLYIRLVQKFLHEIWNCWIF